MIKNELVSRLGCLFLKFQDRNCGGKDRDLFLGLANKNKNAKRNDQQNGCGRGYDPSRFPLGGRNIYHVTASEFFVGPLEFGNELVVRGEALRRFRCDHSLQNPRGISGNFGRNN